MIKMAIEKRLMENQGHQISLNNNVLERKIAKIFCYFVIFHYNHIVLQYSLLVMHYLLMLLLIAFLARLGLALFKKRNVLDKPGNDLKFTRKPVPTLQGIFVYLITLAVLAIFHREFFTSPLVQGFLVG
jgi:magnesium-transporting ATPase (P-type)